MFCNSWCNNTSTNFSNNSCGCNRCNSCGCNNNNRSGCNNGCGCNSCGCNNGCGCNNNGCGCSQRTNGGCGWYTCPCSGNNNFFWLPSTVNNQVPPTTPTVNLGYFTNPSAAAIATGATIPVVLSQQIGLQITSSGNGALLPTGAYEVSYSLSGTPVATPDTPPETVSVGLRLNGVTVPDFTQSASTTSTTDPYNISSHGIINVTAPNSILTLANLGAESQNFTDVNLVVRKI